MARTGRLHPYHAQWMRWHTWRDFATGKLGNWGPHSANLPFMALRADSLWTDDSKRGTTTLTVEAEVSEVAHDTFPRWESVPGACRHVASYRR